MPSTPASSFWEYPRSWMCFSSSRYISTLTLISSASEASNPRSSRTLPFVTWGIRSSELFLLFIFSLRAQPSLDLFPSPLRCRQGLLLSLGSVLRKAMQHEDRIFMPCHVDHPVPLAPVRILQLEHATRDRWHRPDRKRSRPPILHFIQRRTNVFPNGLWPLAQYSQRVTLP